jgi:threonine dehydrogenase-like Zn-dependent dehydrogenase
MLALTVTPGKQNSLDLENVGSPPVCDDAVIVRVLTHGICGTDLETIKGEYGWSPPGTDQLITRHFIAMPMTSKSLSTLPIEGHLYGMLNR